MLALASTSKYLLAAVLIAPFAILGASSALSPQGELEQVLPTASRASQTDEGQWTALLVGPPRGRLEPCGCSGGQLGGIDRLQTMLSIAAPVDGRNTIRIAAGGAVSIDAEPFPSWARAQLETLWLSYSMMGMDVVGLSKSDLSQAAELQNLQGLIGQAQIIATNLNMSPTAPDTRAPFYGAQYKSPMGGPQVYSFLAPGLKLVTGTKEAGDFVLWESSDPVDALKALEASGIHDPAATSLALFEGSDKDATALAAHLGEGSVVLRVNDEYEASHALQNTSASAATADLGTRLRYVVGLSSGKNGLEFNLSTVSEDVPGDPNLDSMRGMYRMMLESYAARESVADSKGQAALGGYIGSDACMECHQIASEIWQESLHSHAMETLADDLRDGAPATQDPNCIQCHSVGFGFDSGFGSRTHSDSLRWDTLNGFAGVGCESCHGPGAKHSTTENVADIDRAGEHTCLQCHDSENDPDFDFVRKWPNIEHNNE